MGWLEIFDSGYKNQDSKDVSEAKKILVVDDEPEIANVLKRYLTLENHAVMVARDGQQGLEMFRSMKPDIILSDIRMPRLTGTEFLKAVRQESLDQEFILVTGFGDQEQIVEAIQHQASDFIFKPIDIDVLLKAIARANHRLALRDKIKTYTSKLEHLLEQVNYSQQYTETVLQSSPSALLTYDADGVIRTWNEEAERITGFSAEESIGRHLIDIFILEDQLIRKTDTSPAGRQFENVINQIMTKNHEIRYISRNAKVLTNEDEEIIGAVESFTDITDKIKADDLLEKRYLQVQTINEIGKLVAESNQFDPLVGSVIQILHKTFFESSQISFIYQKEEGFGYRLSATIGNHNQALQQAFPDFADLELSATSAGLAITRAEQILISNFALTEQDFHGLLPVMRCSFAFPIRSRNDAFAVLILENLEPMTLDESDMFMLEAITEYLSISYERIGLLEKITNQNQQLEKQAADLKEAFLTLSKQKEVIEGQNKKFLEELRKAGDFQRSLLNEKLPEVDGFHFSVSFTPSNQLGGDYYDVFHIDEERIGLLLADASGHGVTAAMLSAMFKMTFFKYARTVSHPAEMMAHLNREFCTVLQMGEFFTAFYAILNLRTGKMVYSNAAHPWPLLYYPASRTIERLDSDGFLLGVMESGIEFEEKEIDLNQHCRLVIYTDGVIEAETPEYVQFGMERLESSLRNQALKTPQEFITDLMTSLLDFRGVDNFEDDVTLIVMEKDGHK